MGSGQMVPGQCQAACSWRHHQPGHWLDAGGCCVSPRPALLCSFQRPIRAAARQHNSACLACPGQHCPMDMTAGCQNRANIQSGVFCFCDIGQHKSAPSQEDHARYCCWWKAAFGLLVRAVCTWQSASRLWWRCTGCAGSEDLTGRADAHAGNVCGQVNRDQAGSILIEIAGDGFLYHMVRKLVAALVEVGANRLSLQQLCQLRDQGAQ